MDIKTKSLSELEAIYKERVEHWRNQRAEHLKKAEECAQQIEAYDQKLRHIVALVNGPSAAAAIPAPLPPRRPARKQGKRRRKSPIRDATLKVLRNRPGQKLTVAQIRTAIRKDTHKRCSRQAINVGVDILEKMGLIKCDRAPKGSGAQFVFWAL
ncbi:MAG: hypothetical protein GY719_35045 [bacterium]|nr:hypothetical protein [bacterium]